LAIAGCVISTRQKLGADWVALAEIVAAAE
jgi:hypothetical protein